MAPTRGISQLTVLVKRSSGGLSKSAIVGIAIVCTLVGLAIIAYATFIYRRDRKTFQSTKESNNTPQILKRSPTTTIKQLWDSTRRKPSRRSQRLSSHDAAATKSETEQRPASRPAKYWSADDLTRSKIGTTKSSVKPPSVMAFPTDSNVFKLPAASIKSDNMSTYAGSIFSGRTKVSAHMTPEGPPIVVRPSSRAVKTWSKHISMQFVPEAVEHRSSLDDEATPMPKMSLKDMLEQSRRSEQDLRAASDDKRNSRAIVTDLNWMVYEPAK